MACGDVTRILVSPREISRGAYEWERSENPSPNAEAFRLEIWLSSGRKQVVRVNVNSHVVEKFSYIISESSAVRASDRETFWQYHVATSRGYSKNPRRVLINIFAPERYKDHIHVTEIVESGMRKPPIFLGKESSDEPIRDIHSPSRFDTGFPRLPEEVFEYDPLNPVVEDSESEEDDIDSFFISFS